MELIDIVPDFNLYEEYWKIYTRSETLPPQYISESSVVERSIIGEGTYPHRAYSLVEFYQQVTFLNSFLVLCILKALWKEAE